MSETSEVPALPPSSIEALVKSPSRAATRLTCTFMGASVDRCIERLTPSGRPNRAATMRKLLALAACSAKSTRPDGLSCRCSMRPLPFRASVLEAAKSSCSTSSVPLCSAKRASSLPGGILGSRSSPTRNVTRRSLSGSSANGLLSAASAWLAEAGVQNCQSEPSAITSRKSRRSLSRLSSISGRSPPWSRKLPRNLVPLSSPVASARLSSPSPMLALAVKTKSPIEACPDMSRSPAAQRVRGRKPEPSTLTGPANTGPNSPRVSRPDVSMLFLPGSTALSRPIVSTPSLAVSVISTAPTRSPPRLACSMATCSEPSRTSPASPSTSSANI